MLYIHIYVYTYGVMLPVFGNSDKFIDDIVMRAQSLWILMSGTTFSIIR